MAVRIIHDPNSDLLKSRGYKPRRGQVLTCSFCSGQFYRTPSKVKEAATRKDVYCSRQCAALGRVTNPEGVDLFISTDGVKRCVTCRSADNGFYRDKKTPDGLFSKCRKCVNAGNKAWRLAHPERTKEISRETLERQKARNGGKRPRGPVRTGYYQSEEYKAYKREYFQRNKQTFRERGQRWTSEHPERAREFARRHDKTPKARLRNRLREARRRAAIKSTADGSVTPEAIHALLWHQRGMCNLCECDITIKYEVDHIKPVSKGGPHTISNIQLLCKLCNVKKSAKILPPRERVSRRRYGREGGSVILRNPHDL